MTITRDMEATLAATLPDEDRGAEPVPHSPPALGRRLGALGEAPVLWRVAEEMPVAVLVNGESFAVMMTTPADLEDFALGFALTEGLVASRASPPDIRVARIADGFAINLTVPDRIAQAADARRRTLPGRSGCGICGAQTLGAALPRLPRVAGEIPSAAALRAGFASLSGAQPMRAVNHSTHGSALCDRDGAILLAREDIGRHNALDKLIGGAIRVGIAPRGCFVVMSSRLSVELVQKAAILGVPLLAGVSAPSALALRQAARAGMTLAALGGSDPVLFDPGACLEGGLA